MLKIISLPLLLTSSIAFAMDTTSDAITLVNFKAFHWRGVITASATVKETKNRYSVEKNLTDGSITVNQIVSQDPYEQNLHVGSVYYVAVPDLPQNISDAFEEQITYFYQQITPASTKKKKGRFSLSLLKKKK